MNRFVSLLLVLIIILLGGAPATLAAASPAPWQQAENARAALVAAQVALLAQDQAEAQAQAQSAQTALIGVAQQMQPLAPVAAQTLEQSARALTLGTPVQFADRRAQLWTQLLDGSMQATLAAIAQNNPDAAQAWLRVRAFRKATKVVRSSADATQALAAWRNGTFTSEQAQDAVRADLLDSYQALARESLAAVRESADRQAQASTAEQAALAAGYFAIVRASYANQRGEQPAQALQAQFEGLRATSAAADWPQVIAQQQAIQEALRGFTIAPLDAATIDRKGQQIYQFINLLQIEYAKGIRNGVIVVPLEVQEAQTFHTQATVLLDELAPGFGARDAQATSQLISQLQQIGDLLAKTGDPAAVTEHAKASMALLSDQLGIRDQGGDLVAVQALLRQLHTEIAAGDYATAEATRLQAYAIFEIGAEQQLRTRNGVLGSELEALFWQGTSAHAGLAVLIDQQAKASAISPTIERMQAAFSEAQGLLGAQMTPNGAILAALAILVREGLEAVLVIGALLGYLRATKAPAKARNSVLGGAGMGLLLTFIIWLLAQTILTITAVNRELFEGIVALIAAAMLIYVTNWLLHKVYVVDWISFVKQQVQQALGRGSIWGFAALGFAVVAREGFETVLFIQALAFDAPGWAVATGVALGLAINLSVALLMLRYSVKLPLKPFFTLTSALLLILAVSFVGNGLRNLQEAGMISVNRLDSVPVGFIPSLLGLFPTIETVSGQILVVLLLLTTFLIAKARSRQTAAPVPAR